MDQYGTDERQLWISTVLVKGSYSATPAITNSRTCGKAMEDWPS